MLFSLTIITSTFCVSFQLVLEFHLFGRSLRTRHLESLDRTTCPWPPTGLQTWWFHEHLSYIESLRFEWTNIHRLSRKVKLGISMRCLKHWNRSREEQGMWILMEPRFSNSFLNRRPSVRLSILMRHAYMHHWIYGCYQQTQKRDQWWEMGCYWCDAKVPRGKFVTGDGISGFEICRLFRIFSRYWTKKLYSSRLGISCWFFGSSKPLQQQTAAEPAVCPPSRMNTAELSTIDPIQLK